MGAAYSRGVSETFQGVPEDSLNTTKGFRSHSRGFSVGYIDVTYRDVFGGVFGGF